MEPIAIVGIGCRFPGAHGPEELWKLLRDGVDAITEVPSDRWNVDEFYDADPTAPGKMSTRWGGFLRDVDCFDREFFGISPREAAALDPQQRLLLEATWEALEDAGQVRTALTGSNTGVFVGISTYDYALLQAPRLGDIDAYWGTGNALSIAANRISYMFDLRGPSLAIDTACSSSLVAVHMACQSLWSGEAQLAIAGGVNVILSPLAAINFTKAGVMAPDGRCKTFDASADGYVRGEGVGIVVLKPLERALADRDAIRAVIRGGAVGQDGRTNGLMAPNRLSQEAVLRAAYRHSGVAPSEVDYVEAHGTGTLLGDMMEARALGNILGRERPADRPCVVGSLKSNIGHLEAAAGVAGLIKTVLMLEHRLIPSSLHIENPNPQIDFQQLRLRAARASEPWPRLGLARAGVSSFGFGGTNAHLVVEEAPSEADRDRSRRHPGEVVLLPVSARTPGALRQAAERLLTVLDPDGAATPDLDEIVYTAAVRRSHHRHRMALVANPGERASDQITAFLTGEARVRTMSGDAGPRRLRRLVFVCSGQGPRWWPLPPALQSEPALRTTLEKCDQLVQAETGWSLLGQLEGGTTGCRLDEPDFCQPTLFALQVALANLWRSWGITPDAVVGHSMGEVAAAHIAGALSLEDAVRVICHRGRLIRTVAGSGRMAVLELSAEATREALRGREDYLSLAAVNAPTSSVISGDAAAVEEVVGQLRDDGVFCRILESVDFASHSRHMEPVTADLAYALRDVKPTPTQLPMYSTVTGMVADGGTLDGTYWAQNLRAPVHFGRAIGGLFDAGHDVFVELSPHPVLLPAIAQCAQSRAREAVLLASLHRDEQPRETLLTSLGRLYTTGFDPAWDALYPEHRRPVRLPSYPWQRERCWFGTQRGLPAYNPGEGAGHPLLGRHVELADLDGSHVWEAAISVGAPAFLDGHRVDGAAVVPAAAWLEMVRAAATQAFGEKVTALTAVEFQRMLVLHDAGAALTQLRVSGTDGHRATFRAYACPADGPHDRSAWTLHATGQIAFGEPSGKDRPALELDAIRNRCGKAVAAADHYSAMRSRGLEYGPALQAVEQLWLGEREALAALAAAPGLTPETGVYGIHPAILDAGLQVLDAARAGGVAGGVTGESPRPYVPIGIDRVVVRPGAPSLRRLYVHARLRPGDEAEPVGMAGDVWLADGDGTIVAVMEGVHARRLDRHVRLTSSTGLERALYEVQWRRQDRLAAQRPGAVEGGWLIFADTCGVAAKLAEHLAERGESAVLVIPGDGYDESNQDRVTIRPDHGGDVRRVVEAARVRMGSLRGVVHLWSLDAPTPDQLGAASLRAAQVRGVVSVLHLVHALTEGISVGMSSRLWLVTSGVHRVGASQTPLSVAQSPVWGLGRVTAFEHPELRPALVDLDPGLDAPTVTWLAGELLGDDVEDQVACRAGERYAARLVRAGSPSAVPADAVREDATYLVTGGMGALGLHVARWLVERGARHLVLLGRRGPDDRTGQQLRALRAAGTEIRVARADVSDADALAGVLTATESMPPLRGVVHAAGILDDATLRTLSPERLLAVLEPKVTGAWNVHTLTAHLPLDFFVMFSSAAALLGSPGQGNYAAGNAFLDALASLRASHGRPGLSVAWGPWANTGLSVRAGGVDRLVALAGVEGIEPADGVEMLGRLLGVEVPQVAVMAVDWRRWAELSPIAEGLPLVADLVAGARVTPPDDTRAAGGGKLTVDELLAADPADRQGLLESYLGVEIARALEMPQGRLDADLPLNSIGLDSLVAVGIKNKVEVDLGMSLPLADALEGSSLRQLAVKMLASTTTGAPPRRDDGPEEESWEEFKIL
jgi:myxalamid-type polyketide synthase MxaE and MxaD